MEFARDLRYQFPLMRGEDVRVVQKALMAAGTVPPCGTADGLYGDATGKSVAGFQAAKQLAPTGVVDAATWAALFRSVGSATAPSLRAANEAVSAPPPAPASVQRLAIPTPTSTTQPPLNRAQALRARAWLTENFRPQIEEMIAGIPIDLELVCAIACKETAVMWLGWIDKLSTADILARCVFDASGDAQGTSRSAFPRNTAEFRERYADLAEMLIDEANRARALRNLGKAAWVYKGYGIFQYDLQHIDKDPGFFRERQWADFAACMDRFMREFRDKLAASGNDVREAVRRYNGSGPKAEEYADHVLLMRSWLVAAAPDA